MPAGDNTKDRRWQPDLDSSWRRVREEEQEAAEEARAAEREAQEEAAELVVYSPELSFVPNNRRAPREASDAQTRALIRHYTSLQDLPHGAAVIDRLEHWKWPWSTRSAADKQRYLEPLIADVRRDPAKYETEVIFLLVVFEPVRRSVSRAFRRAAANLAPTERDARWNNRSEVRMLRYVERERLEDVTRGAVLEAILRYPADPPESLFGWLRQIVAHRALDALRDELPGGHTESLDAPEARAVGTFLDLLPDLEAPAAAEEDRRHRSVIVTDTRRFYATVELFFDAQPVRIACEQAIGRLPRKQGEVVRALYLRQIDAATAAHDRDVARSTIYNHVAQAHENLCADDTFFLRLHALGIVRDRARRLDIERRYPGGRLPDGRRRVVIDEAA